MTSMEFRAEMLSRAVKTAELLCEGSVLEDKKIEPEQIRKNVATIQSILIETQDFLAEYLRQCSDSDKSISEIRK